MNEVRGEQRDRHLLMFVKLMCVVAAGRISAVYKAGTSLKQARLYQSMC